MCFYSEIIQRSPHFRSTDRISDLALLEPGTRAAVQAIVRKAAVRKVHLMVFETYRSTERQLELFRQGRTKLRQVGVHHYGLACDLVRIVDGRPNWTADYSLLGALASDEALIWGGDWGQPDGHHGFVDADHVQRCALADQHRLFAGTWYPADNYNPRLSGRSPSPISRHPPA